MWRKKREPWNHQQKAIHKLKISQKEEKVWIIAEAAESNQQLTTQNSGREKYLWDLLKLINSSILQDKTLSFCRRPQFQDD